MIAEPEGIITRAKAEVVTTKETTTPCNNVLIFFVISFIDNFLNNLFFVFIFPNSKRALKILLKKSEI